jgi:hypothetical protein
MKIGSFRLKWKKHYVPLDTTWHNLNIFIPRIFSAFAYTSLAIFCIHVDHLLCPLQRVGYPLVLLKGRFDTGGARQRMCCMMQRFRTESAVVQMFYFQIPIKHVANWRQTSPPDQRRCQPQAWRKAVNCVGGTGSEKEQQQGTRSEQ